MRDRRSDLLQNQDDIHRCHCQAIPDRGYWATPPTSQPIYDPMNDVIWHVNEKSTHSCSMMFGYKICWCGVASNGQLLKNANLKNRKMEKKAYSPPHVGYALTISAMLEPSVKHIVAPRIQHHTTFNESGGVSFYWLCAKLTDEGPPRRSGVLSVIATLEAKPCSS